MMHLQNAPTSCQKPYDETLRLANISDNHLVRCLGYFWLGEYLFANGSPEKQEYMVSAMETSARLKFKALTLYMEKRLASRSIEYFRDEVDADRLRSRFQTFPTTLTMDHLFHVNQVIQSSTDTYKALEGSARLLMNHYGGSDVYVIESKNGKESITFSSHRSQDPDALIQFVTPYMNMSTSLFLPIPDLSWGGSEDSEGGVGFIEELWSQGVTVTSDTEDQEATVAVHQVGNEGDRRQRSLEVTNGQPPVMMKGRRLKMGALIPLAGSEGVKGVIFIEDIGELYKQHSVASRHELSLFGAQLGFMLECRREENSQLAFMAGRYQMDEVFWLKLWQHGQLRKSRQSTWYLGLEFSPTKYIVAFCDFAGDQTVRETLSGTIWHHLQTIKFLLLANPDVPSEISDLRDDIAHILGRTQGVRSLTRVSAVVSVFDYSQMKIFSGHFGPARPVILGQESKIKPLNSAVLQFDSRADLRYWELEGDLTKTNPFFISYDNSKLEGFMFDELQQTLVASLNQSWSDEQLHEAIASKLGPKSLPRCYVAALLSDEVNLDLLESYDKAQ
jgi:hypothetical protein